MNYYKLLTESGDELLLETGDSFLLENYGYNSMSQSMSYYVINKRTISKTITYNILRKIEVLMGYFIRTSRTISKAIDYEINKNKFISKVNQYCIITTGHSLTESIEYLIKNIVVKSIALEYRIAVAHSQSLSMTYDIFLPKKYEITVDLLEAKIELNLLGE